MTSKDDTSQKTAATQTPDERWLDLLAQSGQTKTSTPGASPSFLSKLKRVDTGTSQQGNAGSGQPASQLFARLVQAGASSAEATAEIEVQSLAKALSQRRVKLEAQVPKADEALFAQLQKRLTEN